MSGRHSSHYYIIILFICLSYYIKCPLLIAIGSSLLPDDIWIRGSTAQLLVNTLYVVTAASCIAEYTTPLDLPISIFFKQLFLSAAFQALGYIRKNNCQIITVYTW